MKVQDLMISDPVFCTPELNLGAAVEMLSKYNCGILPVVDAAGKVTGVVTDRDICIGLGMRNQSAAEIVVGELASPAVYVCKAQDDVRSALQTMAQKRVRRLPVVDAAGKLVGILSIDDIILHVKALGTYPDGPTNEEVVDSLRQIYGMKLPAVVPKHTAVA
jgi:CBS domain-containing protein